MKLLIKIKLSFIKNINNFYLKKKKKIILFIYLTDDVPIIGSSPYLLHFFKMDDNLDIFLSFIFDMNLQAPG